MVEAEPHVAVVVAYLFDVHWGQPVQGVKIFRHNIVRDYPFVATESFEMDQNSQLESAGHEVSIFEPDEVADSDDGTLGLHGTHFTAMSIYERFYHLQCKYRRDPAKRWVANLNNFVFRRFLDEGSELDLFATMGAIAGRLVSTDGAGEPKDFRKYENLPGLQEARDFFEANERDTPNSADGPTSKS